MRKNIFCSLTFWYRILVPKETLLLSISVSKADSESDASIVPWWEISNRNLIRNRYIK